MIIFGSKVVSNTLKAGKFNCPNCRKEQTYQLKSYKKFFHIFFIPLVKIKELGEVVECFFCQTAYVPGSILSLEEYEAKNQFINSTGENSHLIGITPADFSKRVGAFVIDAVILYMLFGVVSSLGGKLSSSIAISMLFLPFVYCMACDLFFKGSSVGKMILSLKVVDYKEEQKVLPFYLILRNLLKCISAFFLPLLLVAYFNQEKRGLHDLLAKTIVVDK
jgi:uncharacterized RDD family membrane protein YckC